MRAVVGWLAVLVLVLLGVPALAGEDTKELRTQLMDLERQIRMAEMKASQSENIKGLLDKVTEAKRALDKAISELPKVKEIDTKLNDLRKQQMDLMKERTDAVKAAEADLKEPKKTVDEANDALKKALAEVPEVKELMTKRDEIQAKLKAASGGGPKKSDTQKKPEPPKAPEANVPGGANR